MASIISVTLPSNRIYGNQETLDFTVTFDEAVTITPDGADSVRIPITLDTGSTVYAVLQGTGTSSTTHTFSYIIAEGNLDATGIELGTAVELIGNATVLDANNAPATLTFTSLGDTTGILVDAVAPTITSVAVPASGTYSAGQTLDFTVTFSEAVTLNAGTGSIRLPITLGTGEPVFAELQGPGTDPNTYLFRYTIAEGNVDTDGIQVGTGLEIAGDATVVDAANNSATLTFTEVPDTTGILVDAVAPTITAVAVPTAGTYGLGQNLDFTVTFSEPVTLTPGTGSIQLPITLGTGEPVFAQLQGPGTEPNSYVFRYTIAEGNVDADGIQVGEALELVGDATAADTANNTAALTLAGVADTTGIVVDAIAPSITAVTVPANGTYGVGQNLDFTVAFSEAVTLTPGTGAIRLPVNLGTSEPVFAELQGPGTDPNTYVFRYTIAEGNVDTDGIQVGEALELVGDATVVDAANNTATLTLAEVADTTGIVVDGVAPTITNVIVPGNTSYGVGQNLDFTVTFSEAVTLTPGTGSIRLPITLDSGEPVFAELQGPGTEGNSYIFRYTVTEGAVDADGIGVGEALELVGDATVVDAANNNATLTLAGVADTTGVLVDGVVPTITGIALPANGTYGAGQNLDFTVTFSEAVTLNPENGFIQLPLTLDSGEPVFATLQGPGTDANSYVFRYTVGAGDVDANGIEVGTAIAVTGDATVQDIASNSAVLTLPTPGDTTGILVDAVTPTVTNVAVPASGTYGVGQNLDFTVTFSEAVTLDPGTGSIRLPITLEGSEPVFAELQGPGTEPNSYVFRYTIAEGNVDPNGIQVGAALELVGDATVVDAGNNNATLALTNVGDATGVIVDAVAPTVTAIAPPADGLYGLGQSLEFAVTFSEAVTVDSSAGIPSLSLVVGSETVNAAYVSGSETDTLRFGYTIEAGDEDTDGIEISPTFNLNGATIADAAGNAAAIALDTVPNTGAVVVGDGSTDDLGAGGLVGDLEADSLLGGAPQETVNYAALATTGSGTSLLPSENFPELVSASLNPVIVRETAQLGSSTPLGLENDQASTANIFVPVTTL